jgi:hypothetical protein
MRNPFARQRTGRTDLQIVADHLASFERTLETTEPTFNPTETEAEQAYLNHLRSEFKRLSNTQDQVQA